LRWAQKSPLGFLTLKTGKERYIETIFLKKHLAVNGQP
jgi:hypothetical protein